MTIRFIGDEFTATERVLTGLHSLDYALGDSLQNFGWPLRSFVELYGPKNCGKTSFMLSIGGLIANYLSRDVVMLDWEGQSKETVGEILSHSGFDGSMDYVLNISAETSEETAKRFALKLYNDPQPVCIIDSLAAFRPTANMEGELNDANMGVMARETGRFADWIIAGLQRAKHPASVMTSNHIHPTIGSYVAGTDTAGGVKKKYLAQLRIDLKRTFLKTNKDPSDKTSGSVVDFGESWLLGGRIDSSRFGYSKREFNVFMVAGEGIHLGLTAVFDCIVSGLAEVSSKKVTESATVSMDGRTYKIRELLKERADEDLFKPFQNVLRAEVDTESNEPAPKKRGRKHAK